MRKVLGIVAVMTASGLLFSCGGGEDPQEVAERVAREWTVTSVEEISLRVIDALIADNPILEQIAASQVADQIKQRVSWTYSTPTKENDDRYQVVATANMPVDISLAFFQRSYDISLAFNLTIDTKEEQVINWAPDLGSLSLEER